jgi:LemA protein
VAHRLPLAGAEVVEEGSAAGQAAAVAPQEDGKMYFTFAAVTLSALAVLWYLLTFNSLVAARNAVDQAWSHIEVELARRFDLIQNLVEVAKGYARHERETFTQVASLRTQPHLFSDAKAANHVQPELTRVIGQIMVLAENYPELRADQSFLNLQLELSETENRIADRRHAYNQTVNAYANLIKSVPSNVVAEAHCFEPREFFDAPDESVELPKVELT